MTVKVFIWEDCCRLQAVTQFSGHPQARAVVETRQ